MRATFGRFSSDLHIHHNFATSGLQYGGPITRFAAGLEAWFKLPEHGMKEYEILARGSLFLTPASKDYKRRFHVVAPAHVTHPWRFRHFYRGPDHDWLDAVHEDAVKVLVTVREEGSGNILYHAELDDPMVHPMLDLSVYGIGEDHLGALSEAGLDLLPLELARKEDMSDGTPVVLVGNDKRDEKLFPCWLNGSLQGQAEGHAVVATRDAESVMGMCGGPAIIHASSGPVAAGLIFARVDSDGPLKGTTVLVTAPQIAEFTSQVEKRD